MNFSAFALRTPISIDDAMNDTPASWIEGSCPETSLTGTMRVLFAHRSVCLS